MAHFAEETAQGTSTRGEKKNPEESRGVHAPEKRIKGVTTSNVALTGNWTILFAIEVVMALVAWSRYTTMRHSTIETSGPSQEVRHTCSGVCVPIIRAPAPPLQCVPSSMARAGSNHATDMYYRSYVRGKVSETSTHPAISLTPRLLSRRELSKVRTDSISAYLCTYHTYLTYLQPSRNSTN